MKMMTPIARRLGPCLFAGLILGGCASTPSEPRIETRTVEIPTPVRCHPDLGAPPDYPDTDAALQAAPDLFARVRLLLAGRLMRIARDQQTQAALQACAG